MESNFRISLFDNKSTAKTCVDVADQRAENLAILGVKNVIELCVGPSLKQLERAYTRFNIQVTGNDIEQRWQKFYPKGKWIIGDALNIDYSGFDAIVFAPPLSHGCSGKRNDSLRISQVKPSYKDFLKASQNIKAKKILVLPGRSFATKYDRRDFYEFTSSISNYQIVPMKSKKIVKYYDFILE